MEEEYEEQIETNDSVQEEQKEKLKIKMSDEDVLKIVNKDLDNAKQAKNGIEKKIIEWRNLYNAELSGNEVDGRSKYVSKDAKKNLHWFIPNAMKPFMSTDEMVETMPQTADDMERAKSQGALLNYQFTNDFDRFGFLHQSIFIMSSEGTVVSRTGWEHDEITEIEELKNVLASELQVIAQHSEITEMEQVELAVAMEPVYNIKIRTNKVTKSRPTVAVIKNEDFFILGESIDTSEACIQRIETTRSELRKQDKKYNENGIYKDVDKIIVTDDSKTDSLSSSRTTELEDYGRNNDAKSEDKSREKVTIYEYYGNIDVDGDGIAEPIVCVFSGETIIRLAANPFPDKKPPFIGCPFSAKAFGFWGDSLAEFVGDVQKVKTAIMRTFIDLMANSTNGMNHVQKGSIDALNIKRLREAKIGTVVEWNDINGYRPAIKNDIPHSLMQMYELFSSEGENETGITKYNQGLDSGSLNKTATGVTAILNQSQMRMWETTARFSEQYLRPLFRKWIAYNQAYLSEPIAIRIAGNEYVSVMPDDIGGKFDIKINVAIAGSSEQKAQHIMQLFQTAGPLVQGGIVPPAHLGKLFSRLEELWGFKDLSSELKHMIGQQEQMQAQQQQMPQDPMQQQMMQQQMMQQEQMLNPNQQGVM